RIDALEAKNREIEVLNTELRRQVGTRSEQLADSLAKLGPVRTRPDSLKTGDIVDERYRVMRAIAAGGMGAVFEVERSSDNKRLALKVLSDSASGSALARFAREAQMVSQIDHPNVISIVDVGVSSAGQLFLVMELVSGVTLED